MWSKLPSVVILGTFWSYIIIKNYILPALNPPQISDFETLEAKLEQE